MRITKPQLRALRMMAAEDDGAFSAGVLPIHRIPGRMVNAYRIANALIKKGFATRRPGSENLYITESGRAAIAKAEGRE